MFLRSVFDSARNTAATVVLASSMMTAQAGMAEQVPLLINIPSLSNEAEEIGPETVDRLVVFAIDISRSVENDEYRTMMRGFADALKSEDMLQQLEYGMSFAIVTSFFCASAKPGEMAIIRTKEDAEAFAKKAFWNTDTGNPYGMMTCGSTNISAGLGYARNIIIKEFELNIRSHERSVIVAGDGESSENQPGLASLNFLMTELAQGYKTVVYGIPIIMHDDSGKDLVDYYARFVTPPGLTYDTGEGYDYPLKEGRVTPASGFEDVARAARETFMLSMY